MEQSGYLAFKFKFFYHVKTRRRKYNKRSEIINGHITGNELILNFLEIPLNMIGKTFSDKKLIFLYFLDPSNKHKNPKRKL